MPEQITLHETIRQHWQDRETEYGAAIGRYNKWFEEKLEIERQRILAEADRKFGLELRTASTAVKRACEEYISATGKHPFRRDSFSGKVK